MRHFRTLAAATLLLLVVASPALADIAPPDRNKVERPDAIRTDLPFGRMTIESVEGLREARLQVPRDILAKLAPAAPNTAGLVDGATPGGFRNLSTVVAGLFLSLSLVLAGLLLVRSRRRVAGRALAAALVCVVAAGAAAIAAYANAAPPPRLRVQDPGTLRKAVNGKPLAGSVRIEVVDVGSDIKLLVPARDSKGDDEE
jgi:hypothetical protein